MPQPAAALLPEICLTLVASLTVCSAASAGDAAAVSPGAAARATTTATTCPTFSWSLASGAVGYELIVYRAEGAGPDEPAIVEKQLPGATSSWTPPLETCLPPGGSFAWAVRALGREKNRAFSEPLFFRTPAAPTAIELRRALEVLQAWQLANGSAAAEAAAKDPEVEYRRPEGNTDKGTAGPALAISGRSTDTGVVAIGVRGSSVSAEAGSAGVSAFSTAASGDVAGLRAAQQSPQGTAALLEAPNGGQLLRGTGPGGQVFSVDADGNLAAATLTGDGSGLSGIDADTVNGQQAADFAPTLHPHSGADIVAGIVTEPRIDPLLARDVEVMPLVLANDGPGSGLDADTLDGKEASVFVTGGQTCPAGQVLIGINADGSIACGYSTIGTETTSTVDSLGGVGTFTSIAIGSDGLPIVSYRDHINKDLRVAHCNDLLCSSAVLNTLDSLGGVGSYTSIAIGSDGLPIISYRDHTNDDLRVAHCDDLLCSSAVLNTLDSLGDTGFYTSITIGGDGLPIISYQNGSNQDLKIAHCNDRICSAAALKTLDATGDVGQHTSIAIGSDGLPIISYSDSSNNALKIAHCADVLCTSSRK